MSTFNFNKFLSKIAKKGDVEHIDEHLRDERGGDLDAPDTLTENQIDKDRKETKETTTEEKLEKVRTGSSELLVEGLLNDSKSKLHQHRNEDASAGDINKLEEQRMANKNRQETEKQEPSSETGKKNRLLDNDTSKDDGLKLAGWGWEFGKTARVVPQGSPSAMYYCKDCGAAYDVKPSMTPGGQMCEKCGGVKISEVPGKKEGIPASDTAISPIPLDPSKPMPKLQSAKGRVVTSRKWEYSDPEMKWDDDDPENKRDTFYDTESAVRGVVESEDPFGMLSEDEDTSVSGIDRKLLRNPAFDVKVDKENIPAEDLQEGEEEDAVNFDEKAIGTDSSTGTRMMTFEVVCLNTEDYEDEVGLINKAGERKLITDVIAYLVSEHPELQGKITRDMFNTSRIKDGKIAYTVPV